MANVVINDTNLTNIAEAIRTKNGETTTYKPSEMAAAILAIEGGGSELPEVYTGDCSYLFANKQVSDVLLADLSKVKFEGNVTTCEGMFLNCKYVDLSSLVIPMRTYTYRNVNYNQLWAKGMFKGCGNLTSFPQVIKLEESYYTEPGNCSEMFYNCYYMRELPSWFNKDMFNVHYSYDGAYASNIFNGCYSLRSVDGAMLKKLFKGSVEKQGEYTIASGAASSPITHSGFHCCFSLDELTDVPIFSTYGATLFTYGFVNRCNRLSRLTFSKVGGSGTFSVHSEVLDLTEDVGWANLAYSITDYNSGITADKEVTDDATYAALKNDPDWFTCNASYSRYNKTSALETINSLPNTSAYLTEASAELGYTVTNTIKFKGSAGSKTDGGAINTMTESQIASAAAKGWTVAFV